MPDSCVVGGSGIGDPPMPSSRVVGGSGMGDPPMPNACVGGSGMGDPPMPATLRRIVTLLNTTNNARTNDKK
jgi:hypothetical protein